MLDCNPQPHVSMPSHAGPERLLCFLSMPMRPVLTALQPHPGATQVWLSHTELT